MADTTVNIKVTTTRSGRVIKKPDFYVPVEEVCDDYASDEYDSEDDDSDVESVITSGSDMTDDDDDLEGFVVDDDDDDDDEEEADLSNELKNFNIN